MNPQNIGRDRGINAAGSGFVNRKSDVIRQGDAQKRTKLGRRSIKRLPAGIRQSFVFPTQGDPKIAGFFAKRTVPLISKRKFKQLETFNPAQAFVGSLKLF